MRFYGLSARIYDYTLSWLFFGNEKKIRSNVTDLIPNKKLKILDIGCGTGSQLIEIKIYRKNAECYGIDSSKDMLEISKNKAKKINLQINFQQQNYENLKFKSNFFDIVTAFLALHETNFGTRTKAIKEIKRVLKKTGKLILVDYEKTEGIVKSIQKIIFFFLEPFGKNFVETKEKAFSTFKKLSSQRILGGALTINEYKK